MNLYAIVGNNTVNRVDVLGMGDLTGEDISTLAPFIVTDSRIKTSTFDPDYRSPQRRLTITIELPGDGATGGAGEEDRSDGGGEEAPNNAEHPDCAGLRSRLAQAREVQGRNAARILPGGVYAGGVSLSTNDAVSLTAGFVGGLASGLDLALRDRAPLQGPLGTEIWRGNGAANAGRALSRVAAGVSIGADGYALITADNNLDRAMAGANLATTTGVLLLPSAGMALLGPSVAWIGHQLARAGRNTSWHQYLCRPQTPV